MLLSPRGGEGHHDLDRATPCLALSIVATPEQSTPARTCCFDQGVPAERIRSPVL
jgi:hypothetical protein